MVLGGLAANCFVSEKPAISVKPAFDSSLLLFDFIELTLLYISMRDKD